MNYIIHITATAERDIIQAANYIEFTLKNPSAAEHLLDVITEQINSLADFPEKFRLVDDPVLTSWGIRFILINHYLAFYTVDTEKQLEFHPSSGISPYLRISEPFADAPQDVSRTANLLSAFEQLDTNNQNIIIGFISNLTVYM